MIEKILNLNGREYKFIKKIKSEKFEYAEYRDEEKKSIKFFEIENEEIKDISDKNDLRKVLEQYYIIDNGVFNIKQIIF